MEPSPEQQRFIDFASKDFGFLVKDFGFTATPDTVCGTGLSFAKDSLALKVSLGWYKGEVDLVFQLLLENSVFRPYISRLFNLGEIVHHMDPNAITNALNERPPLPKWALSAEDAHCILQYHAMLVQKFCLPLLKGDFAVLEAIYLGKKKRMGSNRRGKVWEICAEKNQTIDFAFINRSIKRVTH